MPLATDENLKIQIENKISELAVNAHMNKALILTETDLQCHLYNKLTEIPYLNELSITDDGFTTNKIHTEISWFDDNVNHRLSIRPDMTLLEPQNLRITSGFDGVPLPSKGLHSIDGGIIFELKYDRQLHTISEQRTVNGIIKDIINYETIYNRFQDMGINHEIYGYFVLFIKSSVSDINMQKIECIQHEFNIRGLNQDKCKFIYSFIGVN